MEGFDHQEARKDIPEVIQYLNEKYQILSLFIQACQSILSSKKNLPATVAEYSGELRATQTSLFYQVFFPLNSNEKEIRLAEQMLERYAEPMAS